MEQWMLVLLLGLTLNLIVRTHQDVIGQERGSGGGDDDASGDDGTDEEGSAVDEDLTPCQRQVASPSKIPGAFPLQCTRDGAFKPMQCHPKSRDCWCVDREGKEVPRTRQTEPSKPRCTGRTDVISRRPPGALPDDRMDTRPPVLGYTPSDGDDIVLEESSTPKPITSEKPTMRRTPKIQTTTSAIEEYDDHSDENVDVKKPGMFAFIFKDPLILAGIIGGAVLALLCIVLLIMFTIYRMRKKDEGSYALDEPKKSYGFAYTRARDQEFFA